MSSLTIYVPNRFVSANSGTSLFPFMECWSGCRFFLKPSRQVWICLHVRDKPCADAKHEHEEDDEVVPTTIDTSSETDVSEPVELKYWIVAHEIYHTVLTDVVDNRYSLEWQLEQQSRKSKKDYDCIDKCCKWFSLKPVCRHNILSMPKEVAHDECNDKDTRQDERVLALYVLKEEVPSTTEVEEERSHEDVVE